MINSGSREGAQTVTIETHLQHIILTASNSKYCCNAADGGFTAYVDSVSRSREEAKKNLSIEAELIARLQTVLGIDVEQFLLDSATLLGTGTLLQRILTDKLRARSENGTLNQVASHRIVDLWGKLEASRALFGALIRLLAAVDKGAVRGATVRAQSKVLLESLSDVIVEIAATLGSLDSFTTIAPVTDWALGLVRGAEYASLEGAVAEELVQLSA